MGVIVQSDRDNDQIYIALDAQALKAGAVHHTRRIDENIAFDYDVRGKLIGIDVMNVSRVVSRSDQN